MIILTFNHHKEKLCGLFFSPCLSLFHSLSLPIFRPGMLSCCQGHLGLFGLQSEALSLPFPSMLSGGTGFFLLLPSPVFLSHGILIRPQLSLQRPHHLCQWPIRCFWLLPSSGLFHWSAARARRARFKVFLFFLPGEGTLRGSISFPPAHSALWSRLVSAGPSPPLSEKRPTRRLGC